MRGNLIIELRKTVTSLITLGVVAAVCIIAYMVYRRYYIRFFWLSHSESDFKDYVDDFLGELHVALKDVCKSPPTAYPKGHYNHVLYVRPALAMIDNWERYFKNYTSTIHDEMLKGATFETKRDVMEHIQQFYSSDIFGKIRRTFYKDPDADVVSEEVLSEDYVVEEIVPVTTVEDLKRVVYEKFIEVSDFDAFLSKFVGTHPFLKNLMFYTDFSTEDNTEDIPRWERLTTELQYAAVLEINLKAIEGDLRNKHAAVRSTCCEFMTIYAKEFGVDPRNVKETSIETLPDLYILILMSKHIDDQSDKNMARVNIMFENIGADEWIQKYIEKYYDKAKSATKGFILESVMAKFKRLLDSFVRIRNAAKAYAVQLDKVKITKKMSAYEDFYAGRTKDFTFNNIYYDATRLNILIIDLYTNDYIGEFNGRNKNTLARMSLMRQYGGMFNFTIPALYLMDYVQLCFNERIVGIWKTYWENTKTLQDHIYGFMMAKETLAFFPRLPYMISGMDHGNPSASSPPVDNVEHFIGAIFKIASVFIAAMTLITSLIWVSLNPIQFLLFVIGWIVSIILFIAWIILAIYPFTYLYAIIIQLVICLLASAYWVVMFVSFAALYIVLGLLDTTVGGAIMRLLRCENAPSMWHTQPNWHRNNIYDRTFFCSYPCRRGFYASGLFCVNQDTREPRFAPHQTVFNDYKRKLYEDRTASAMMAKLIGTGSNTFGYNINLVKYADAEFKSKVELWRENYNEEIKYTGEVLASYKRYNKITEAICHLNPDSEACQSIMCHQPIERASICERVYIRPEVTKKNKSIILTVLQYIIYIVVALMILKQFGSPT